MGISGQFGFVVLCDEEVRFPKVAGHSHGVHEGGAQGPLAAGA
jgi:hypothetical protein